MIQTVQSTIRHETESVTKETDVSLNGETQSNPNFAYEKRKMDPLFPIKITRIDNMDLLKSSDEKNLDYNLVLFLIVNEELHVYGIMTLL